MAMKSNSYNELVLSGELYSLFEVKKTAEVFSPVCKISVMPFQNNIVCTITQMPVSTVRRITNNDSLNDEIAYKTACKITFKEFENYLIRISRNDEITK